MLTKKSKIEGAADTNLHSKKRAELHPALETEQQQDETPLKKTDIFALLILFTMIVVMLIIPVITCLPFIALII